MIADEFRKTYLFDKRIEKTNGSKEDIFTSKGETQPGDRRKYMKFKLKTYLFSSLFCLTSTKAAHIHSLESKPPKNMRTLTF